MIKSLIQAKGAKRYMMLHNMLNLYHFSDILYNFAAVYKLTNY